MTTEIKTGQVSPTGLPVGVFGWPADTAACGTYRIFSPLRALARKHGVQVEWGTASELPYTVLVAQRTHGEETVAFLEHVKANRQAVNGQAVPKIVYELDDNLWAIESDNPGYKYYTQPGLLDRAARAIELADAVTVSTEPLADIVRQYNENVYVLPNSVPSRLLNEAVFSYSTGPMDKPYVLGWAGSATHLNDFKMCVSSVNTLMKFNPNTRMVFFGTDYSGLLDPSVRSQCRTAPWTKTVADYHNLLGAAQIDVMLAPLAPSIFNESKSNLRLIEANALGIPVIATDWGPYHFTSTDTCSAGVRYVTPGESWLPALTDLQNGFNRLTMSAAGRDWVFNNYTIESNCDMWLSAYKEILSA